MKRVYINTQICSRQTRTYAAGTVYTRAHKHIDSVYTRTQTHGYAADNMRHETLDMRHKT